jgi:hypothetical protein
VPNYTYKASSVKSTAILWSQLVPTLGLALGSRWRSRFLVVTVARSLLVHRASTCSRLPLSRQTPSFLARLPSQIPDPRPARHRFPTPVTAALASRILVAAPLFSSNRIVVPTRRCRHLPPHCCWSAILLSSCSLRLYLYVLVFDHHCNFRSLSEEVELVGRLPETR